MVVRTVESKNGDKDHIVVSYFDKDEDILVACGHTHFDGPMTAHSDVEEIEDVCQTCKENYVKEHL